MIKLLQAPIVPRTARKLADAPAPDLFSTKQGQNHVPGFGLQDMKNRVNARFLECRFPAVLKVRAAQRNGVDAVAVESDAMLMSAQRQITTLAIEHQLPAIYEVPELVQDGGLISYGASITEMTRRSAMFVDKILKGLKPG
jgi:ABC transporter substrate binding protein